MDVQQKMEAWRTEAVRLANDCRRLDFVSGFVVAERSWGLLQRDFGSRLVARSRYLSGLAESGKPSEACEWESYSCLGCDGHLRWNRDSASRGWRPAFGAACIFWTRYDVHRSHGHLGPGPSGCMEPFFARSRLQLLLNSLSHCFSF